MWGLRNLHGPRLEFPTKLNQEVRIIRPRQDGSCYLACPKCGGELDAEAGEWIPLFPDRRIHGYRINQLFSSKIDPGEILTEYQTTRFPDRFYNLKIGIAWSDTQNRVDAETVLRLCRDTPMLESVTDGRCTMGVDTGKDLHVVISRRYRKERYQREIVYLGVEHSYADLDALMKRFRVRECVIDALPEIHATRSFASRHYGDVWLDYFSEHQKGEPSWDMKQWIVQENRTEALDLSRDTIRKGLVHLPRRTPIVEEFAKHMASNAKRLEEDEETGEARYKYVKAGADNFSLARHPLFGVKSAPASGMIGAIFRGMPLACRSGRNC